MALSASTHYKSTQYPFVKNMIFEEFVTDGLYLQNECNLLMQLVSTVFRNRKDGKVFLIGNTISRVCPYFYEWELRGIPKPFYSRFSFLVRKWRVITKYTAESAAENTIINSINTLK